MQSSSQITHAWIAALILGMTGISCTIHKSAVSSGGESSPPHANLSQIDSKTTQESVAAKTKLQVSHAQLPLSFEPNQGQTDERVNFLARGRGYTLFLTSTETVLALRKQSAISRQLSAEKRPDLRHRAFEHRPDSTDPGPRTLDSGLVLYMHLVGANPNPQVAGVEELPGKVNYFRSNDPQKWRTNIPTYAKVKYQNVYPGVDLAYYGNQRQLEYDFIVSPGADPKAIRLGFDGLVGAQRAMPEIEAAGDLILHIEGGEVRLHKPVVYQEINGGRQEIPSRYVLFPFPPGEGQGEGVQQIGFAIAAYDTSKPLIIDPVLSYSTYLGGSGVEEGQGIAVDSSGNAHVTGYTASVNFPTANSLQVNFGGGPRDAFVAKLNAAGSALVYSTYLGGSDDDAGSSITLDSSGNAYVTGNTASTNFPTTPGSLQATAQLG